MVRAGRLARNHGDDRRRDLWRTIRIGDCLAQHGFGARQQHIQWRIGIARRGGDGQKQAQASGPKKDIGKAIHKALRRLIFGRP